MLSLFYQTNFGNVSNLERMADWLARFQKVSPFMIQGQGGRLNFFASSRFLHHSECPSLSELDFTFSHHFIKQPNLSLSRLVLFKTAAAFLVISALIFTAWNIFVINFYFAQSWEGHFRNFCSLNKSAADTFNV